VYLLDATEPGWDEAALRQETRELTTGAPYSSRSYRFPYALMASHSAPLGVDIERVEPPDPAFVRSISTPAELGAEREPEARYGADLWSSKEALAKALGDALEYDPRRLESPLFWPDGSSGVWRALALPVPAGHVGWLCWRTDA
jgi:4'-phosphopantetheinyl transferase superfamily